MNEAASSFIEFVQLNDDISRLQLDIKNHQKNILEINKDLDTLNSKEKELNDEVHNLKKKIDSLDLELKSLDELKKEKKKKMDSAADTKAYFSLEHELKAIEKQRGPQEEELFSLWQSLEKLQEKLKIILNENPEKRKKLTALLEEANVSIEQALNRIENYKKELIIKEPLVSDDLISKYKSMKAQLEDPVVSVSNDSCSRCFYAITPGAMQSLRKGDFITCKDCYRMLYLSKPNRDA